MTQYQKKPIVVEATQWWQNGDHPKDGPIGEPRDAAFLNEGKVVRYYRSPLGDGNEFCQFCKTVMHIHGWIDTLEGGHIVCPGDWIITGIEGEHYPCKPNIFEKTYDVPIV